jgi:transcriptional regulator
MQTKIIRIKKETYHKLVKKGKLGETLDDIINRILDSTETEDIKTMQMTNSIMNLKSQKKHKHSFHHFN